MNKRLGLAVLLMCAVSGLHAADEAADGSAASSSWSDTLRKGTQKFKKSMHWDSADDLTGNIAYSGPIHPKYQLLLVKTYLLYRLGAWGYNKYFNNQQEDE